MQKDGPTNAEISQYDPAPRVKRKDALISLFYVVVVVLCGIPMWLATTTTYRASLPEADMARLAAASLEITIEVDLVNLASEIGPEELREVRQDLLERLEKLGETGQEVRLHYTVRQMREGSKQEMGLLQRARTASELLVLLHEQNDAHESALHKQQLQRGGIRVLLVPADTQLVSPDKDVMIANGPGTVAAGSLVMVLVRVRSVSQLQQALTVCIGQVLANQEQLQLAHRAVLEVPDKRSLAELPARVRSLLTRVRSASRYEWSFSLVVPQPRASDGGPEWDFPAWERHFLEPVQRQLGALVAVRVSSQLVYGVRLPTGALARLQQQQRGARAARPPSSSDDVTHLVNGLEAYLGGAAPNQLHFVVVMTPPLPKDSSPLDTVTAFTVPGWGAVLLLPENRHDNSSSSSSSRVDGAVAMAELLPRLHDLMGFPGEPPHDSRAARMGIPIEYEHHQHRRHGNGAILASWQLQGWLRERTVENLAVSRAALRSLLVLLDRVVTMVIRDEVAEQVRTATARGLVAVAALRAGDLPVAFLASRQALEAAETAFFQPSLLELLYFQDDQKIGIYIPLFVPVLVPLALAAARTGWPLLLAEVRRRRLLAARKRD